MNEEWVQLQVRRFNKEQKYQQAKKQSILGGSKQEHKQTYTCMNIWYEQAE